MDHGGTEGDPPAMPGWKRLQEGDGAPDVCPSCGGPAPVPLQVCVSALLSRDPHTTSSSSWTPGLLMLTGVLQPHLSPEECPLETLRNTERH